MHPFYFEEWSLHILLQPVCLECSVLSSAATFTSDARNKPRTVFPFLKTIRETICPDSHVWTTTGLLLQTLILTKTSRNSLLPNRPPGWTQRFQCSGFVLFWCCLPWIFLTCYCQLTSSLQINYKSKEMHCKHVVWWGLHSVHHFLANKVLVCVPKAHWQLLISFYILSTIKCYWILTDWQRPDACCYASETCPRHCSWTDSPLLSDQSDPHGLPLRCKAKQLVFVWYLQMHEIHDNLHYFTVALAQFSQQTFNMQKLRNKTLNISCKMRTE